MITRTGRKSKHVLRMASATFGCDAMLFQSTITNSNFKSRRTASAVRARSERHMRCSSPGESLRVTTTNETKGGEGAVGGGGLDAAGLACEDVPLAMPPPPCDSQSVNTTNSSELA